VPALVLATTALRFAATGLFQITAAGTWEDVAGIVGLVLCGLAVYAAAAMAIEDAGGRTVLPLGRRGAGATSVGGPFGDQLRGIEREAGVRGQL
jgi:hypothetical protein